MRNSPLVVGPIETRIRAKIRVNWRVAAANNRVVTNHISEMVAWSVEMRPIIRSSFVVVFMRTTSMTSIRAKSSLSVLIQNFVLVI